MPQRAFVPEQSAVPRVLRTDTFRFEPLGPQHNAADFVAWTSSIEHIRATPGFTTGPWPREGVTVEQNLRDVTRHAEDFAARTGFTYTVLDQTDEVIGCVYIYPSGQEGTDAEVSSWVRADHAELDRALYEAVIRWLDDDWPFTTIDYAPRAS